MKRAAVTAEQVTELSSLPLDVVELILAMGAWKACGALARASRHWMRTLTSSRVVSRLIKDTAPLQGHIHESLPPWLFYALPASLVGDAPTFTWSDYVDGRAQQLVFPHNLPVENYFYTGGDVAKRLYGMKWQSDIDVWTTDEALRVVDDAEIDTTHDWDFIVKSREGAPTQRCIEKFDLSVVQQGFLEDSVDAQPVLYTTPLAVCSQRSKKLFIAIDALCLNEDYNESLVSIDAIKAHNTIHRLINKHRVQLHHTKSLDCWSGLRHGGEQAPSLNKNQLKLLEYRDINFKLNTFFENCELCMATLMEKNEMGYGEFLRVACCHDVDSYLLGNNQTPIASCVVRWTKRVMKYRNRFTNYDALYVVNPLVRRQIEALEADHENAKQTEQAERTLKRRASGETCEECQGSTVAYLTDDVYGPCMACSDWENYDRELARRM